MKTRKPKLPRLHQYKSVQSTICRADLNTFGEEEACDGCPLIDTGPCIKIRGLVPRIPAYHLIGSRVSRYPELFLKRTQ